MLTLSEPARRSVARIDGAKAHFFPGPLAATRSAASMARASIDQAEPTVDQRLCRVDEPLHQKRYRQALPLRHTLRICRTHLDKRCKADPKSTRSLNHGTKDLDSPGPARGARHTDKFLAELQRTPIAESGNLRNGNHRPVAPIAHGSSFAACWSRTAALLSPSYLLLA